MLKVKNNECISCIFSLLGYTSCKSDSDELFATNQAIIFLAFLIGLAILFARGVFFLLLKQTKKAQTQKLFAVLS